MATKKPAVPTEGADTSATYPVLSVLHHDGVEYSPGKTVVLDVDVASPLMALGVIGEAQA